MDPRIRRTEIIVIMIVVAVFIVVAGKYLYPDARAGVLSASDYVSHRIAAYKIVRPPKPGQLKIAVPGGFVYREKAEPSVWLHIYDTYPKSANGKEVLYGFLDQGDITSADKILDDYYAVDRFAPTKIAPQITWKEDPYKNRYWRFIFYALRPTRHLIFAANETGQQKYDDKLLEIVESFLDKGMKQPLSWQDNHAVAFRTMVLVNVWWKLREHNALPIDVSTKLLQAIKEHGDYLSDVQHYEPQHNHGINQAAALLVLATNFPDMPGSKKWLSLARDRFDANLRDLVDKDGVLVENSPYYHFYALRKYWEIYNHSITYKTPLNSEFNSKIQNMVEYCKYILQPDSTVPLLGASLKTRVCYSGNFRSMADADPYLRYTLTAGKEGDMPPKLNVYFPTAGQTIMRSGWEQGKDYKNQTQLILDVGPFRTQHSDMDALSFNLFGAGIPLMPDSGLYTYEHLPLKDYFHGTRAHNTVVVDGKDQDKGAPSANPLVEGDGYALQSAESDLYTGVKHKRAVILLGKKFVVIIDELTSKKEHKYEQMFHLFPEAKLKKSGMTLSGIGASPEQAVTIRQLNTDGLSVKAVKGQTKPYDGFCSFEYEKAIPNYSISYEKRGKEADFITLLEIGKQDKTLSAKVLASTKKDKTLTISTSDVKYSIATSELPGKDTNITIVKQKQQESLPKWTAIEKFENEKDWKRRDSRGGSIEIDCYQGYQGKKNLRLVSSEDGSRLSITKRTNLDLSNKNLLVRMKASNISQCDNLTIDLSSHNWQGYASCDLREAYAVADDNNWMTISLGKGSLRNIQGQWRFFGSGFDWSKIDRIGFSLSAVKGKKVTLNLDSLATVPGQDEGRTVICFDDGSESVLDALPVMNRYGIKGNVAVTAERPDCQIRGYLTLTQLKRMQNINGWDIVSHSAHHRNALTDYYEKGDLAGFEQDIVDGAEYLEENGINSAPNWYVYPNGAINPSVKQIVSKYYRFARSVSKQPEVYPFGDPYAVKIFEVFDTTKLSEVHNAVADAKLHKLTLILVFHRIWPGTYTTKQKTYMDYDLGKFEAVVKDIADQKIKVVTFSELDRLNHVPELKLKITKYKPAQLTATIDVKRKGFLGLLDKVKAFILAIVLSIIKFGR